MLNSIGLTVGAKYSLYPACRRSVMVRLICNVRAEEGISPVELSIRLQLIQA